MGEINAIKEFCDRMKVPEPEYVFHDNPTGCEMKFRCEVTLGNCCGEGAGDNKKEAKRNAARSLYKDLEFKIGSAPQLVKRPSEPAQPFTDYVSQVNLLCQKEGCSLPTFQLISHQGLPPNEMFTMQCKVREYTSVGNGSNKKSAKQSSAKEMLDMLNSHLKEQYFLNA